jgi:hypothetical protein
LQPLKRAVFIEVGDSFSGTFTSKVLFFESTQASEVSAGSSSEVTFPGFGIIKQ